jgi:hypothetical protein
MQRYAHASGRQSIFNIRKLGSIFYRFSGNKYFCFPQIGRIHMWKKISKILFSFVWSMFDISVEKVSEKKHERQRVKSWTGVWLKPRKTEKQTESLIIDWNPKVLVFPSVSYTIRAEIYLWFIFTTKLWSFSHLKLTQMTA